MLRGVLTNAADESLTLSVINIDSDAEGVQRLSGGNMHIEKALSEGLPLLLGLLGCGLIVQL